MLFLDMNILEMYFDMIDIRDTDLTGENCMSKIKYGEL